MDNTTPHNAKDYDNNIERTVPFYSEFYRQVIDLVKVLDYKDAKWIDTGCGTGTLVALAENYFKDYKFVVQDPSKEMIEQAKEKLDIYDNLLEFKIAGSENMDYNNEFNIVTAIQCHHYFDYDTRVQALQNCYNALKDNGVLITFENIEPSTEIGRDRALKRWSSYQINQGKSKESVEAHIARYGISYFPIPIDEHVKILKCCGFRTVELFWFSNMQAGIYALK